MATPRTRSAIEWADIVGATLVVGNDSAESDFRTVQEAYDNLPPEGGLIIILQGTLAPSATVTLGSKSAIFRGTSPGQTLFGASGGTIIDLGANAFPAFTLPGTVAPFVAGFAIEDITFLGTLVAGQHLFQDNAGTTVLVNDCFFGGLDRLLDAQSAGTGSGITFNNCQSFTANTLVDGPGTTFTTCDAYGSLFFLNGPVAVGTHTACRFVSSNFNTFGANFTMSLSIYSKIVASRFATVDMTIDSTFPAGFARLIGADFEGGSLTINAGNCHVVGSGFSNATVTVSSSKNTFDGCDFESSPVTVTGARAKFTGCDFTGNGGQTRCLDLTVPGGARIANCDFSGCNTDLIRINATSLDVTIVGCAFEDDATATRAIDIATGAFRGSIVGNSMEFFDTEAIRMGGARWMVASNTGCKVRETGTANINRYANNDGLDPSLILGGGSLIENENVVGPIGVDTTLDEFMRTVLVTAAAANRTETLPPAASAKWRKYTIKKTDATANTVTIDADGAETIDGAASIALGSQYESVTVQSDGTQWWIV